VRPDGKSPKNRHSKFPILYISDELFEEVCTSDNKLHCTIFEPVCFEMKEGFSGGLTRLVETGRHPILPFTRFTTKGDNCSAFSRFPESKFPLK
jgi:hypothetical protein